MTPGKGWLGAYEDWFAVVATILEWFFGAIFLYFFIPGIYVFFAPWFYDWYFWPLGKLWRILT